MSELKPNEGKKAVVEVDGVNYLRLPIRTHVITDKDKIEDVAVKYAKEHAREGDIFFVSEKAVACTQRRAIPLEEIKPRKLARFLTKFVYKSPFGIGLGMPETMEMALRECGVPRILFAAGVSAIGKLFRQRGWFYKIAGYKAESIDGPTPNTLPPYNRYVVLGPAEPDEVAKSISKELGIQACVVDINDLAGRILGASHASMNRDRLVKILKDNPLGQSAQQTPMGLIRKVNKEDVESIEAAFKAAREATEDAIASMPTATDAAKAAMAKAAAEAAPNVEKPVEEAVTKTATETAEAVKDAHMAAAQAVEYAAENAKADLEDAMPTATEAVKDAMAKAAAEAAPKIAESAEAVKEGAAEAVEAVKENAAEAAEAVSEAASDAMPTATEAAKDAIDEASKISE
ncbi:MAG: coenzyme F420-0:L-glutamate ligase [Clostridia bacterium]|nr:coenzyme F420-0:L-glutamate ligase [Clostridia bacterium]